MKISLFITLLLMAFFLSSGQKPIDSTNNMAKFEEKYTQYRDSARKIPVLPAVSILLLKNREIEIVLFNALLSANTYWDNDKHLTDLNGRITYLYNSLQLSYGISKKSRLNLGLDVNAVTGRLDNDPTSSLFKIFNPHVEGSSRYASSVSSIAPRIRWRPLKNSYNLTIQSSISFPTISSAEKKAVIGQNQVNFLFQSIYSLPLSKRFSLFGQLSLQYGFKNNNVYTNFYAPVSIYVSYLLLKQTVVFGLLGYTPIFQKVDKWKYEFFTSSAGLGIQHNITRQLLLNVYYYTTPLARSYGNYKACNIGLRLLLH